MKQRLDKRMVILGLVPTRSQAESYIKLGKVRVNGTILFKPGVLVGEQADIKLLASEQYVSRAGLKLASVAKALNIQFKNRIVLDVGSSTGGFTDYALQHGAKKVIAVDVGTNQLHPKLAADPKVELHEQTDIRDFKPPTVPDIAVIDVSFISLREILPHVSSISGANTMIVAMCKPQFEAGDASKHKGVVKNDKLRRGILREFENWLKPNFIILDKSDSQISGAKGNTERFYLLNKIENTSKQQRKL